LTDQLLVVGDVSAMEIKEAPQRKYSRRTLRDEHGQYPAWMNQRAIRKQKSSAAVAMHRKTKVKSSFRKKSKRR